MLKAALLFFVACTLIPLTAAADVSSQSPAQGRAQVGVEDAGSPLIPKWRFSVRLYGSFGSDPQAGIFDRKFNVGIYRRMGSRDELGFGVDCDLDFRHGEMTSFVQERYDVTWIHEEYEADAVYVELYSELRRWNRISDDVTWYFGPRASFGLEDVDYERASSPHGTSVYVLGVSVVAGGDLKLLEHLSLSFGFLPVKISYVWFDQLWTTTRDFHGTPRTTTINGEDRILAVDFEPRATAFLNFVF